MSIYKKLNEVQKKASFVKKDGELGYGQNKFSIVTHDAVLRAIRTHLTDIGIVIVPSQVEKGISVPGKTSKGGDKIRFEALYDVAFIDIDDDSKIVIRTEAHAEDNSDKAANKAITYAVKNAMLKAFLLETGDDNVEEMKNTIDVKQTGMIAQLIADTDTDMKKFLEAYKIQTVAELPQAYFTTAINQLQAKQKKQGAKSE